MVLGVRPSGLPGIHRRSWPQVMYNGVIISLIVLIAIMIVFILSHSVTYHESDSIPLRLWEQARDLKLMGPTVDAIQNSFAAAVADRSEASFYHPVDRPLHDRTFCLVLGAEGTGSTWMSKILPANYRPNTNPSKGLTAVIHRLWSSGPTALVARTQRDLSGKLRELVPDHMRLGVLHVSAPDWDALHYPDLHSELWPAFYRARINLKILVMYRDPAQAAHSNHRRGWKHLRVNGRQDIACSARSTEKHMTLLSEQIRSLPYPDDVLVVDYHRVLNNPREQAARITRYLNLGDLQSRKFEHTLLTSRRGHSNYTKSLSAEESGFLDQFFDTERRSKWDYLVERTHVA